MAKGKQPAVLVIIGLLFAVASAATSGCGTNAGNEDGPARRINAPNISHVRAPTGFFYNDPVWIPSIKRLVVTADPGSRPKETYKTELHSLTLDGAIRARISIEPHVKCPTVSRQFPTALSDTRLGFIEYCLGDPEHAGSRSATLRAFDFRRGMAEQLTSYNLPFFVGRYTFSPNMEKGIVNDGRGLSERLQFLRPAGLYPLDLPFARAGHPRWSPDGKQIAVDAVAKEEGADSAVGPTLPRSLYLLNADGTVSRRVLSDLRAIGPLSWSPDGAWLAGSLAPKDEPPGLYIVHVDTGRLVLVREGNTFGSTVWLPHTRTLVAAVGVGNSDDDVLGVGLAIISLPADALVAD